MRNKQNHINVSSLNLTNNNGDNDTEKQTKSYDCFHNKVPLFEIQNINYIKSCENL